MKNEIRVTTSWDDGHILDFKLANLLKKYDIKGTFYVAPENFESDKTSRLSNEQIKELSKDFEIGAHTISHYSLTDIKSEDAFEEIKKSKEYLEEATGNVVTSFCYPRGKYSREHVEMVKKIGFEYARTVKRHHFSSQLKLLEAKTSIHTYNHFQDIWKIAIFAKFNPLKMIKYFQWDELAKAMFDQVLKSGGEFHLWGHSWEIEKHGDWEKLENVLAYISNRKDIDYVENSKLAKQNSRKILIVAPYFLPYVGGTQIYVYNIAKRLKEKFGWDVCIVTSGNRGFKNFTVEEFDGLKVYRLPYWAKISNTPINPIWPFIIRGIMKRENVSIVNTHSPVPFMADIAMLVSGNLSVVSTYHAGSMRKGKGLADFIIAFYEKIILGFLLRRAERIVCSSDFVRFKFLQRYTYKSLTVTPAVDREFFRPDDNIGKTGQTILFVAGLSRSEEYKGLRLLIDSFNTLKDKFPNSKLVIVGDGDMKNEYENYSRKLGLGNRIAFKGRLFGRELVNEYQKASVLVLPSLESSESFGMVLIEAMAVGLPVIGSIAGGIPMVVDHEKNGLLVRPGDSKSLSSALEKIFSNPDLSRDFGANGLKKAKDCYDWDIQTEKYDKLFESVLEKKPSIAQIVGYYPPHIGGMEIVAKEISKELADKDYQVSVFTNKIGCSSNENEDSFNYRVRRLNSFEIAHTPVMPSLFFRLLSLPKNSILHVHVSQAIIPEISLLVAKIRKFPMVAHFHLDVGPSGSLGFLLPFYKKYFLRFVLRSVDSVIVFSQEQSAIIQKTYGVSHSKISIIPNGVGKEFFYDKIRTGKENGDLEILYTGRISAQKKVQRIVEAIALLDIPCNLKIVGDGEDRGKIEELIEKLGLKNVSLEGKKYGSELMKYYQKADVFVISSEAEGMPLVVLEAMAAGLPIIGTNVIGTKELIKDIGVLVDEPYAKNIAVSITELFENREKIQSLSRKSYDKAIQYSWQKLITKLELVYNKISK
jgi:D-inositol-3-phosphate glycosyltransferase